MKGLRIKNVAELQQLVKTGKVSANFADQIQQKLSAQAAKKDSRILTPAPSSNDTSFVSGRAAAAQRDVSQREARKHYHLLPEFDPTPDPAVVLYRACIKRWGRYYEGGLVVSELIIKAPRAFRADIAIPKFRIAIEMDGFVFHSSKAAIRRDHDKTEQMARLGWIVFRIGAKRALNDVESFLDSVEHLMQHSCEGVFTVSMNKPTRAVQSFFSTLYSWDALKTIAPASFQYQPTTKPQSAQY